MATMDSSASVSSCESLYSVDSTTSEEDEDEPCANFEVFLLDSGSEAEKAAGPLRSQQDAYADGEGFRHTLKSKRTNAGLLCQGCECQVRKPIDLLTSAWLQPPGRYRHYPAVSEESYCARLKDADGGLTRKGVTQRRVENGGRKRPSSAVGGGQALGLAGIKRHRSKELPVRVDSDPLDWTEGDRLFAQKCQELQGFILPLQGLLGRLRTGRFDRGLSTFQQSVAMDRIQRIIGVLQKPGMGERYLGTLLQVERMLKVWFPHIALKSSRTNCSAAPDNESAMAEKPPPAQTTPLRKTTSQHSPAQSPPTKELHQTHCADSPGGKAGAWWGEPAPALADWPALNLTWIHTSPISNPPLGHVNSALGQALLGPPPPNTYGVVLFLHSGLATPGPCDGSLSVTPTLFSLPDAGERPRCQSLPGATQGDISSLAQHSKSLPCLPTAGEIQAAASERQKCSGNS